MSRLLFWGLAEEERKQKVLRIERRRLRDCSNALELPEREFIANFRLDKASFQLLLRELRPYVPQARRKTSVRLELKILAALNFFANGSYQRNVGASFLCNMSQPTFSKCLHEVTDALNTQDLLNRFIKFPKSQDERENIMMGFNNKFKFPGVIGCIDGTHVALIRPQDHEEAYFNRKNYHSLNVLIICDVDLNILHVDASFGGASHDSYVWRQSPINSYLQTLAQNGERCWLLGDSGYAQRPWLMTPILNAARGSAEEHYTELHCSVRNTVERCIGVLKARWRCLLAHRVLHYDPIKVAKIVNACVVLHNIANACNVQTPEPQGNEESNEEQHLGIREETTQQDNSRDLLVQRLWNARQI